MCWLAASTALHQRCAGWLALRQRLHEWMETDLPRAGEWQRRALQKFTAPPHAVIVSRFAFCMSSLPYTPHATRHTHTPLYIYMCIYGHIDCVKSDWNTWSKHWLHSSQQLTASCLPQPIKLCELWSLSKSRRCFGYLTYRKPHRQNKLHGGVSISTFQTFNGNGWGNWRHENVGVRPVHCAFNGGKLAASCREYGGAL